MSRSLQKLKKIVLLIALGCLATLVSANSNQIFYQKLELKPQSSLEAVKKQCKYLMNKLKPEKHPGDGDNHERYLEIRQICQDLTHPEKKQIYDQQGDQGLKQATSNAWGHQNTTPNMESDIEVTLQELYLGTQRKFTVTRNKLCSKCHGTGDKDGKLKTCTKCKGRGHVLQQVQMGIGFNMQMQAQCDKCGGRGRMSAGNCPVCRGNRVERETISRNIDIKAGMKHDQTIVFREEADQHPDARAGNLIFTIKQKPHNYFKRVESTLYTTVNLTLKEAILGFSKNILHLDDHYANINKENKVTQPFDVEIIKGEGMPSEHNRNQKGDMHALFKVSLPKKIDAKDRQILEQIFSLGRQTHK